MMIVEFNSVDLAELSESIRPMPRIPSAHPRARAELRRPETSLQSFEFMGDEAVVEVHVVGDEDAVSHEVHEAVGHFREQWRAAHHLVRDAGQLNDLCRDVALGIEQTVPLADDPM